MKIEAIEELKEKGEIDSESGSKLIRVGHQYPNERQPVEIWSIFQKKAFREAVMKFGRDWKKISEFVQTKDFKQCRSRGENLLRQLKKKNFDPELLEKLS